MNSNEILNKYINLIDKGYCSDCNELNCIDNFPHSKITHAIRELQQENKRLKDNWNKLKEYITYWIIFYNETIEDGWINLEHEKEDLLNRQIREEYKFLLCKMETLEQGSDSNEKNDSI